MSQLMESILKHKSWRSLEYLKKIFYNNGVPWRQ